MARVELSTQSPALNRPTSSVRAWPPLQRTLGQHHVAALDAIHRLGDAAYIKSREKDLKKEFSDPLSNLSVYQGKILMKLINRQTGNNCYEIIKEYKGGLNARFYQTVAWFVGGNLKQDWDLAKNTLDRQIENIVKEIDGSWYGNPYRR
jgi:hypothetical protein